MRRSLRAGLSNRKRVSRPDKTPSPTNASGEVETEPSPKKAATSQKASCPFEGEVPHFVNENSENGLENEDFEVPNIVAENALESSYATEATAAGGGGAETPEKESSTDMNCRLNKVEEGVDKILAFLQASSVQVPAIDSTAGAQALDLEKKSNNNNKSQVLNSEGKQSCQGKLKLDAKLAEVIKGLDVCSEEHILPVVFKSLLKLEQKGSLPSTTLIAIATPQRPPVTTKGSKMKCKTDGKLRLQESSPPTVTFEYIGRVVVSTVINDLPSDIKHCSVTEEYEHFLSEVAGWKAPDPMTMETKFLFSIYRSAITSFRSRTRVLFRDYIGASVAPVSMGGSEDLQVVLAFPNAAQSTPPKTLADAAETEFREIERFVFDVNVRYTVMGRSGSKNERNIHVSLIDLAAECIFWLSGQTHERPPCEIFNGIDHFECLLECLKAYVLPESDECILNARGYAGQLFGVSQESLKQTQRAAEKLTLLTLREAKKLEGLPASGHAESSEKSLGGSDNDSDEELLISD